MGRRGDFATKVFKVMFAKLKTRDGVKVITYMFVIWIGGNIYEQKLYMTGIQDNLPKGSLHEILS